MTLEQWLTQINPTEAGFASLVWILVLGAGLFIWRQWWPWYTKEYYPAKMALDRTRIEAELKAEDDRQKVMISIRDVMVELRVVCSETLKQTNQHHQWSVYAATNADAPKPPSANGNGASNNA